MNIRSEIEKYKAPDIVFAQGVHSLFDEYNSTWRFAFKFKNYSNYNIPVAVFTAWADITRVVQTDSTAKFTGFHTPLGGLAEQLDISLAKKIITLQDFTPILENLTGHDIYAIAHNYIIVENKRFIRQCIWNSASHSCLFFNSKNKQFYIEDLRNFVKLNPLKLISIKIESDKEEQFGTNIILGKLIPFQEFQPEQIDISQYRTPKDVQKLVDIHKEAIIDSNTVMIVEIAPYAETIFSLQFSAYQDAGKRFESRIMRGNAIETILQQMSNHKNQ